MTRRLALITLVLAVPIAFIGRPAVVQSPVTFSDNVAPIIFTKCAGCHRPGEAAPFSLLSYEDVRKRGELIQEAVLGRVITGLRGLRGRQ